MSRLTNEEDNIAVGKIGRVRLLANPLAPSQRWLSLLELAVGSAIVIGRWRHMGQSKSRAKRWWHSSGFC
jgi:hypothetical protein